MDERIKRRRTWGGCGCMPDRIAVMFTQGERAAMSVIGFHASRAAGYCGLTAADIGQEAGVSVSTVRRAVRIARDSGVIDAQRYGSMDHDTLIVGDRRWTAWMRKGVWHGPADFRSR